MRFSTILMFALMLSACRGVPFEQSPIHINPNMDWQNKIEAMEASTFFADGKGMREPVEGTVARNTLFSDEKYTGKDQNGNFVKSIPVPVNKELVMRGMERYQINCTPCHGELGNGKGIIIGYGYVPPPSFHMERLQNESDGYFYDVINNGVRSMPSYRHQVSVDDRWAIVAYIRALQKSQAASEKDLNQLGISKETLSTK